MLYFIRCLTLCKPEVMVPLSTRGQRVVLELQEVIQSVSVI